VTRRGRAAAARAAILAVAGIVAGVLLATAGRAEQTDAASRKLPREFDQLDPVSLELLRKSKAAEGRNDYHTALQFMQLAATYLHENDRWNFVLWDDLASLYCKQGRQETNRRAAASRAAGRAMLSEFKCAVDVWTNKRQCRLPWGRLEQHPDSTSKYGPYDPGLVPNPALTPLCFRTLCGKSFGAESLVQEDDIWGTAMEAEPPEGFVSGPIDDSKDFAKIEQLCRDPRGSR
jgi:hypothetical protein